MNQPKERQKHFIPEAIPQEMKQYRQWVCWRSEDLDNGKTTKIPLDPNKLSRSPIYGQIKAQSNNPETWSDFETATMAAEKHGLGLGFILTKDDPFTGIDIDACLNGGVPDKEASKLLNDFGSYAEVTPSGEGLHIITKAKLAAGGQKSGNLEIYDNLRFLTMTGNVVNGKATIKDGQSTIDRIYKKQPLRLVDKPSCDAPRNLVTQSNKTDEQILKELENHDSVRFEMLFKDCDLQWYEHDHSKADMSFCSMLAMFTQDRSQIDRIFRQSALCREKWDVKHHGDGRTYGEGTLDAVLSNARPVPMVKDTPQDEDDYELISIKDLMEKKFPPINYIISGGILPEGGLLFLAGESGVGKSMLIMEICLHLAVGRQLFDGAFMVPKARRILIIQNENPEYMVQQRVINMADKMGISAEELDTRIMCAKRKAFYDLGSDRSIEIILDQIEKSKADIFVMDPLSSFHSLDENSNSDMGAILNNVLHITTITGAACILLHHYGKPQPNRPDEYRLRGASAIFGKADTVLAMVPKAHEHKSLFMLRFDKVRHGLKPKPILFERNDKLISICTEEDMLVTPRQVVDALTDVFNGSANTQTELSQFLMNEYGVSEKTTRNAIKRAVELNLIQVVKSGRSAKVKAI